MIKTLLVVALMLSATPALARNGDWQVGNDQMHLVFGDIDAGTAAGRATMLVRVEKAAARLCREQLGSARLRSEERECVADIVARAASGKGGQALAVAITERSGTALAGR